MFSKNAFIKIVFLLILLEATLYCKYYIGYYYRLAILVNLAIIT